MCPLVPGFAVTLLLVSCSPKLVPPHRDLPATDLPIPRKPATRSPSLANEILEMTFPYQLWQVLDTPRIVRKAIGRPYESLNVDNFDEVPNSTWFTNRNGHRALSLNEIRRGPNIAGPPATSSPWLIRALKCTGVTPGMTIIDARGLKYIIKFDPPGSAELASGTECVAARLFWAAGYNVPQNYIAQLDLRNVEIHPEAVIAVQTNDKRAPLEQRPLTDEDLQRVLCRVEFEGSRVRVLASLLLPGEYAGPFRYTGVRDDDPNDIYDHEHRREIRGLYVIASWLNHADWKEENTLDMYDPQRRVLNHYLLDFGAAMGSNSLGPSNPRRGQANSLDLKDSLTRLATLGLYVHDYEMAPRTVRYPSVGYLENELFKPDKWKPMYPCPAFENLTARDAFWGARIVTSFSDAQIEAAVSAGEFSNPAAAAHMVRFLVERRDRIGQYWFARLNPLDCFTVDGNAVAFEDLAVSRGYAAAADTRYHYRVRDPQGRELAAGSLVSSRLGLDHAWRRHSFVVTSLVTERPGFGARPVQLFLRPEGDAWAVIGLRRDG